MTNLGSAATFKQLTTAAPTAPASHQSLYIKSDGTLATINSSGVEQVQVDSTSAYKPLVKAASTANLTLSAPQTVDGVSVVAGDRVLVKNQSTPAQNGIYLVAAGSWTRSNDMATSALAAGAFTSVPTGTTNGGTMWFTSFKSTDTIGTTSMSWFRILDGSQQITALATLTGPASFNNQRLTQVGTPTATTDAANWQTVMDSDNTSSAKKQVRMASTGNLSLTGAATIDGVVMVSGDRVLAKNQTNNWLNGIYLANTAGGWFRDTDADTAAKIAGSVVSVQSGTANGGSVWHTTFQSTDTLDATGMLWNQVIDSLTGALTYKQLSNDSFKVPVKAATTVNITLSGNQTIDGYSTATGDRILVKDQTTRSANGIYVAAAGAWARSTDADTVDELSGAFVSVLNTLGNTGMTYRCDMVSNGTIGTTNVNWYQVKDSYSHSVRVVQTSNVPTLSAATATIDGVTLAAADRVLLVNQTTPSQNGIYSATSVPSTANLTRAPGFTSAGAVAAAGIIEVREGTTWGGTGWMTSFKATDTVDTTAMAWGQVVAPTTMFAGGLLYSGAITGFQGGVLSSGNTADILVSGGPSSTPSWTTPTARILSSAYKDWCKAATTANITLSAPQTIDGVSCVAGDRVLVKNQTTVTQNGIYVVAAGAWTRATDFDSGLEIFAAQVPVMNGTTQAGTCWQLSPGWSTTSVIGTNNIVFWPQNLTGTYAPAWTGATTNPVLGNGTAVGNYVISLNMCWFSFVITAGSTTTYGSGQYSFGFPPSPYVPADAIIVYGGATTGTNPFPLVANVTAGAGTFPPKGLPATAGNATTNMTNLFPATWASGNVVARFTGSYRWA